MEVFEYTVLSRDSSEFNYFLNLYIQLLRRLMCAQKKIRFYKTHLQQC
jgi:hypothetical protein